MNLDDIEVSATFNVGTHSTRKADSTQHGVKADRIRTGHKIGKRTVTAATNGTATFNIHGNNCLRPARLVTLDNGKRKAYELGTIVADASGYAEPLPAGGVESSNVKTPAKVRVHDGRWRGEQVHGMTTREHDMTANTNMYDRGRVNGSTTSARGMGSVVFTGPNF